MRNRTTEEPFYYEKRRNWWVVIPTTISLHGSPYDCTVQVRARFEDEIAELAQALNNAYQQGYSDGFIQAADEENKRANSFFRDIVGQVLTSPKSEEPSA
jgi:hypothetical protein